MNNDLLDPELERRFRAALAEMMPHLESPRAARPVTSSDDLRDGTSTRPTSGRGGVTVMADHRRATATAGRRRHAGAIAACLLALVGGGGAVLASSRSHPDVQGAAPVALPAAANGPTVDPTSGPLLTTALTADTPPMITTTDPGWVLSGRSDLETIAPVIPSTACAGCGADRLIVAADGPLFSGPMFTAWVITDPYDIDAFDLPVTIGTTPGRYRAATASGLANHYDQVQVVWPVGDGRTAFVDATGLSDEQVFSMAASLTFTGAVPTMAAPPAGFSVRPTTPRGDTQQLYLNFVYDQRTVPGYNGNSTIELIAMSGGLQALLDWRDTNGDQFRDAWTPATVGGATVLLDDVHNPAQPPLLGLSATWVAGDWAYVAIGHVFNSTQEFLDAITQLQLTDSATFTASTANVEAIPMSTIDRGIDGSGGTLSNPDAG